MSREIYEDKRWDIARGQVFRNSRLCQICQDEGITTVARHVDHIIPLFRGGAHYDLDNLQPLCADCHHKKSKAEQIQRKPFQYGLDGLPLDPDMWK